MTNWLISQIPGAALGGAAVWLAPILSRWSKALIEKGWSKLP